MKTQNISKLALWLCMGIAVVILICFFAIGFDNINDEGQPEPQFTNILIYAIYAYVAVLAVLTIWNAVQAVFKYKDGGLTKVFLYCGGSLILYFLFRYVICGGQEVPEGAEYTATDMATADAYIWTIGILFLVAVVACVICATGILSKSAIKK